MDESVLKGNTAILKCHIPSFVSDFVTVVSWLQEDGDEILVADDGRYGALFFSISKLMLNGLKTLFSCALHSLIPKRRSRCF